MPTPLCLLAHKHDTDKATKHSYTRWYYDTFSARRESIRKVVEIGVGEGGSLRMWREFFPNAQIYGLEVDPARVFTGERIEVIRGDQSKPNDLQAFSQRIGADVDLFIDDGSHRPAHQRFTLLCMMPLLAPGVTYVIEDVAKDWDIFHRAYIFDKPTLEPRNRYDNRLIVVKHRG